MQPHNRKMTNVWTQELVLDGRQAGKQKRENLLKKYIESEKMTYWRMLSLYYYSLMKEDNLHIDLELGCRGQR
jgi:hypothetical protein